MLPGLVDAHSHAFHRALRGAPAAATSGPGGRRCTPWSTGSTPTGWWRWPTAAFGELVLAGVTTVHEFHYLHQPTGWTTPCARPPGGPASGWSSSTPATCAAGFEGEPLDPVQRRFSDGDVERWAARAEKVAAANPDVTVGAAIHSVRAVDPASMGAVAAWARARAGPAPPAPVRAAGRERGLPGRHRPHARPAGPRARRARAGTTAVHCTHVTAADIALLGASGTAACLCPTTERDLADGIGPAAALAAAGCQLRVGTDSHAVVDLFEEARAIELDERLATGRRGLHPPEALLAAATAGGAAAAGRAGRPVRRRSRRRPARPASTPTTRCRCWWPRPPPPTSPTWSWPGATSCGTAPTQPMDVAAELRAAIAAVR